jgi:tetratricopeptide (TPR) repeat protein
VSLQKQEIFLRQNKPEAAIAECRRLLHAFPGESRYALMMAELLLTHKKEKEAAQVLEQVLAQEPDNADARMLLSKMYQDKGDHISADAQMEKAFQNPNLDAEMKVRMLSEYLQNSKQESSALKEAERLAGYIVKLHPQSGKAFAALGDVYWMQKQNQPARDQYLTAISLGMTDFDIWQKLVQLDYQLGQYEKLTEHSDQALSLFPSNAVFYYFNGLGNLLKKNYNKAIQSLEEGKELAIENQELLLEFYSMLGDAYHGNNEHAKSDEAYEKVLKENPTHSGVLNNYSYYLSLRKDKLDKARIMSAKLIDKYPDNSSYLDTHAWVLYQLKEYQACKQLLEKALRMTSDNGTILEHYGDVLFKLGQKEKALEQWLKAKQAGENNAVLDKKIADKMLYE